MDDGRTSAMVRLDRLTLAVMGLGLALMLQAWWPSGFRVGFFVVLAAVVAQGITSHRLPQP